MGRYRCFLSEVVRCFSIILGVVAIALMKGTAAPGPVPPDWERQVAEAQKAVGELSAKLIAAAEDPKAPEEDRWRAVAALGRLCDRASLEYLVDHITLRLQSPDRFRTGADFKEEPCNWALTMIGGGWEGDGRNWNLAQVILRATAKPRTEDELWRYADLLDLALGKTRFSDGTFAKSSRALALVEVELANESHASHSVEPQQVLKDRATRVKNLTALKNLLEKEWGKGGKGRDGK
jgi:hypothetical protein